MSATSVQAWIAVVAALLTAILGLFKYFNYRSERDRRAAVGASFATPTHGAYRQGPRDVFAGADA